MNYLLHPIYKQTFHEWLGNVPATWEIKKLKFLSKIETGSKDTIDREVEGEFPFYVRSDVIERISTYSFDGEAILTAGDGVGAAKVFHYVNGKFDFHQRVYKICDFKKHYGKFLFYYLKENFQKEVLQDSINTTVDSLRRHMFLEFPVVIPGFNEQQTIAKFLDYKTAQIDLLIEKKEQLLKLLEEKRIALITNAVTGRIPSLKEGKKGWADSGIPWLGDIPSDWKVKRLRFLTLLNPYSLVPADSETLVSFLPMEKIHENGGIDLCLDKTYDEVKKGFTSFSDNDVVVAKITPCFENGKGSLVSGLTGGLGFGTTELHVLRCLREFIPEYLFYITISYPFRKFGEAEMYGAGGQKRVPEEFMKDFIVGVPPLTEQIRIVHFIKKELTNIDQLSTKVTEAIEKLKEYRTSLITSAVTGKIDLRNWQPNNN